MKPLISVIVPVYNGEKTIRRCLKSLIKQTLKDIEIIVINDGSTDNTKEIVEEMAEADSRIRLINKQNEGYAKAMNDGFRYAQGEWIGNIDADDKASYEMYRTLYAHADGQDIVKCGFYEIFGDIVLKEKKLPIIGNFNPKELDMYRENLVWTFQPSVWSAIYRKEWLIDNEIFMLETPGCAFQDTSFTFKTLLKADNVCYIPECLVFYTQDNPESSIRNESIAFAIFDEFEKIKKECPEELLPVVAKFDFKQNIWNICRLSSKMKDTIYPKFLKECEWIYDNADKAYFSDEEWAMLLNITEEYRYGY